MLEYVVNSQSEDSQVWNMRDNNVSFSSSPSGFSRDTVLANPASSNDMQVGNSDSSVALGLQKLKIVKKCGKQNMCRLAKAFQLPRTAYGMKKEAVLQW